MTAIMTPGRKIAKKSFTKLDAAVVTFIFIFTLCIILSQLLPGLHAADTLTQAFQTKSFRGSAEALTKANWIGMVLHYIISWFSFLGLCLTLYQKFITLLYLSARQLFDTIYDIKVERMKGSMAGYGELFKGLFGKESDNSKAGGGGIDVFITFFYSLLPNIKAYCDYSPTRKDRDKEKFNDESGGVTHYMLQTAIPTIILIFFLTIGYSGTLAKAYGTIVDGMAAAADQLVSTNLAAAVKRAVGGINKYTFHLADLNTKGGAYAQRVAEEMYNKIIIECNDTPEAFQMALGLVIEDTVFGKGSYYVSAADYPAAYDATEFGILGGDNSKGTNNQLVSLLRATLGEAHQNKVFIGTDEAFKDLMSPTVYLRESPTSNVGAMVWNVQDLLNRAADGDSALKFELSNHNMYIHVVTKLNTTRISTWLVSNGEFADSKKEKDPIFEDPDQGNNPLDEGSIVP